MACPTNSFQESIQAFEYFGRFTTGYRTLHHFISRPLSDALVLRIMLASKRLYAFSIPPEIDIEEKNCGAYLLIVVVLWHRTLLQIFSLSGCP